MLHYKNMFASHMLTNSFSLVSSIRSSIAVNSSTESIGNIFANLGLWNFTEFLIATVFSPKTSKINEY